MLVRRWCDVGSLVVGALIACGCASDEAHENSGKPGEETKDAEAPARVSNKRDSGDAGSPPTTTSSPPDGGGRGVVLDAAANTSSILEETTHPNVFEGGVAPDADLSPEEQALECIVSTPKALYPGPCTEEVDDYANGTVDRQHMYTYENGKLVHAYRQALEGGVDGETTYVYNDDGNLVSVTGGQLTTHTYYPSGLRETTTTEGATSVTTQKFLYNSVNDLILMEEFEDFGSSASQPVTTYSYDTTGRLVFEETRSSVRGTIDYDYHGDTPLVRMKRYVTYLDASSIESAERFSYDDQGNLTEYEVVIESEVTRSITYTYDEQGNRLSETDDFDADGTPDDSITYTYDCWENYEPDLAEAKACRTLVDVAPATSFEACGGALVGGWESVDYHRTETTATGEGPGCSDILLTNTVESPQFYFFFRDDGTYTRMVGRQNGTRLISFSSECSAELSPEALTGCSGPRGLFDQDAEVSCSTTESDGCDCTLPDAVSAYFDTGEYGIDGTELQLVPDTERSQQGLDTAYTYCANGDYLTVHVRTDRGAETIVLRPLAYIE